MSFYRPLRLRSEEPAYQKRNLSPEGDVVDNDDGGGVLLSVCYKTASRNLVGFAFGGFVWLQIEFEVFCRFTDILTGVYYTY